MTEEETILDGISYISSKRASELTGYSQDYIGQLSRSGQIEARRIGGLWFVNIESLRSHKSEPNAPKDPSAVSGKSPTDPDTFVAFDGKSYISASRASKLSGYNQDYIGQLSRSGQILSRLVGNRWYVDQQSLLDHKAQKDALLAAVQRESVGIAIAHQPAQVTPAATMNYFLETGDLLPKLSEKTRENVSRTPIPDVSGQQIDRKQETNRIPIRTEASGNVPMGRALVLRTPLVPRKRVVQSSLPALIGLGASALTIVIVFSLGYSSLKSQSIYASGPARASMPAAVSSALEAFITRFEDMVVPQLAYRRTD